MQSNRVHAFIPTSRAEELAEVLKLGKLYKIRNFTVQFYKPTDKFRCLRNDRQLVFTKDTSVQEISEEEVNIPLDYFDFYDHSQLEELSKQTTYLTDVIGIVKKHETIRDLQNKHGQKQKQSKLVITDGSSHVNITFWDAFGMKFENAMKESVEDPVIRIISCCRVGKFNGAVDIGNVPPTRVYINYKHHVVAQLRKKLQNPEFVKQVFAENKRKEILLLRLAEVKKLGNEYIENKVLTHVRIKTVDETTKWCYYACTGCMKEVNKESSIHVCQPCNKMVPYPDIRYRISVLAEDATDQVNIILGDSEVRTLIMKRARQLLQENNGRMDMPEGLKNIVGKDYTILLKIKEVNVSKSFHVYWASKICHGFINWKENITHPTAEQLPTTTQATTSNTSGQPMSDLDLASN
ncbi:hypothetical protein ACET3Z_023008 [Daucus carota]